MTLSFSLINMFGKMPEQHIILSGAFDLHDSEGLDFINMFHVFLGQLTLDDCEIENTAIFDVPFSVEQKISHAIGSKKSKFRKYVVHFSISPKNIKQKVQFDVRCEGSSKHIDTNSFVTIYQEALLKNSCSKNLSCWT